MKKTILANSFTKITLSLSLGTILGVFASWGNVVNAQVSNNQNSEGYQRNEYDPLYGNGTFNPSDLIHRAIQNPGRTSSEFGSDSDKNITDAAAEFKRQREQLLNQQLNQSEQPANNSTPNLTNN
jgi:hypothetical protein